MYRERFYELQRHVFTPANIMKMRSTQDQRQVNNQAKIIEMRSRQEITSTEHDDIYQFYKTQFYANKNRINNQNSEDTIEIYKYQKF